jgi:hypothetical protein
MEDRYGQDKLEFVEEMLREGRNFSTSTHRFHLKWDVSVSEIAFLRSHFFRFFLILVLRAVPS